MTTHDDGPEDCSEDGDDAPELPERAVLDAWAVPPASPELTDRVLNHVEADPSVGTVIPLPARRRGKGLAVVGLAMVAAAALVLGLAQLWRPAPAEDPRAVAAKAPDEAAAAPDHTPLEQVDGVEPDDASVEPVVTAPADAIHAPADAPRPGSAEPSDPEPAETSEPEPPPGSKAPEVEIPFIRPQPKPEAKPQPKPDPRKTATLRIGTAPGRGWADVSIDGKHVGRTPIMNVKVRPNRSHTVKWVWPQGESFTTTVTLKDGQTMVLKAPASAPKEPSEDG